LFYSNNKNKFFCSEEAGQKSSHYGLHMLGYTRATKLKTIGYDSAGWSKSGKINKVRIVNWNSFAWRWNH